MVILILRWGVLIRLHTRLHQYHNFYFSSFRKTVVTWSLLKSLSIASLPNFSVKTTESGSNSDHSEGRSGLGVLVVVFLFFLFSLSLHRGKKCFLNIFLLHLDLNKYMCDLNTVFKFADTLGNYERFYCFVNIFTGLLCPWRILEWSDQLPLWLRQLMWWNILFNDNKTRCHCIFHCINVKSFSRDLLSCYIMQDESFVWNTIKYREMLYSCCWISTLTTLADIFFDSASVNSSCVRPPPPPTPQGRLRGICPSCKSRG